jgi:hypothetical protein
MGAVSIETNLTGRSAVRFGTQAAEDRRHVGIYLPNHKASHPKRP